MSRREKKGDIQLFCRAVHALSLERVRALATGPRKVEGPLFLRVQSQAARRATEKYNAPLLTYLDFQKLGLVPIHISLAAPFRKATITEIWIATSGITNGIAIAALNFLEKRTTNCAIVDGLLTVMCAIDNNDPANPIPSIVSDPNLGIDMIREQGQSKSHATKRRLPCSQ